MNFAAFKDDLANLVFQAYRAGATGADPPSLTALTKSISLLVLEAQETSKDLALCELAIEDLKRQLRKEEGLTFGVGFPE